MELGKQTLGGHKQNFVHIRTQEKGAVTPQVTEPDFPVSVQSPRQRHGLTVACCRVRDTEYNSPGISPLEGGCHYHHYCYHS